MTCLGVLSRAARAGGRPRLRRPAARTLAARALIFLVALGATGCLPGAAADPLVPSVAGVVVEVEQLAGARVAYRLETGEVVEIDFDKDEVPEGTTSAVQGDLLLSGVNRSGRTWHRL